MRNTPAESIIPKQGKRIIVLYATLGITYIFCVLSGLQYWFAVNHMKYNFDCSFQVKMRILMGTYALSAGYYDAYYKRAQQVTIGREHPVRICILIIFTS